MADEVKNKRNSTARDNRGREQVSEQRNAQEKYDHSAAGEYQSTDIFVNRYLSRVNFRAGRIVCHMVYSPFRPYTTGRASAVVASIPPNPMVSTADEGTMTIDPFSLMAS